MQKVKDEMLEILNKQFSLNENLKLYEFFINYFLLEVKSRFNKEVTKERLEACFGLSLESLVQALIYFFEEKNLRELLATNPHHDFLFNIYYEYAGYFCDEYGLVNNDTMLKK